MCGYTRFYCETLQAQRTITNYVTAAAEPRDFRQQTIRGHNRSSTVSAIPHHPLHPVPWRPVGGVRQVDSSIRGYQSAASSRRGPSASGQTSSHSTRVCASWRRVEQRSNSCLLVHSSRSRSAAGHSIKDRNKQDSRRWPFAVCSPTSKQALTSLRSRCGAAASGGVAEVIDPCASRAYNAEEHQRTGLRRSAQAHSADAIAARRKSASSARSA